MIFIDVFLYASTYLFLGILLLVGLGIQNKCNDQRTLTGLWMLWPIVILTLLLKNLIIIIWRAVKFLMEELK